LNKSLGNEIKVTATSINKAPTPTVPTLVLAPNPVEVVDEFLDQERRKNNYKNLIHSLPLKELTLIRKLWPIY